MNLSYIDTSNFLRGLLILIKKDNIIHEREIELLNKYGELLGLDKEFYRIILNEFLTKEKIDSSIPKFSSKKVTIQFVNDAINMGFVDSYFHIKEIEWLYKVANKNKIPSSFLDKKIIRVLKKYPEKADQLDTRTLKRLKKLF